MLQYADAQPCLAAAFLPRQQSAQHFVGRDAMLDRKRRNSLSQKRSTPAPSQVVALAELAGYSWSEVLSRTTAVVRMLGSNPKIIDSEA